jgi:hypothetical protein
MIKRWNLGKSADDVAPAIDRKSLNDAFEPIPAIALII